jgi:tripartite-type tricarboxylate transporter receptor subunit TctC
MLHVPYKGSAPMMSDLLGGQVVASMDAATTAWPHVQSGKLRALGVSTTERAFFAPELAPISDTVPGFDVKPWHGVMAPAGTPPAIVEKLSQEISAFVKLPATQAKLKERGVVPVGSSAKEFAAVMNDEFELYKKVVKDANIKPE